MVNQSEFYANSCINMVNDRRLESISLQTMQRKINFKEKQ